MSSEIVSKSFKTARIALTLDGSEDRMFIYHNPLLKDGQVMVEQVEQVEQQADV